MSDRVFLDTNILVYAYHSGSPDRKEIARALLEEGIRNDTLFLSAQVWSEFFVTVTGKIRPPLTPDEADQIMDSLSIIPVVEIDLAMVRRAIEIRVRYGISYWDSLIISAAERAGCGKVYSEDLSEGQEYHGIRVVNPFKPS